MEVRKYRYPPLFQSLHHATLLLQKTYSNTCFPKWKKSKEHFRFYSKRQSENSAQQSSCYRGCAPPGLLGARPSSIPWTHTQRLSIKLPELWTISVRICALFYFFSPFISNMCPKVSEKSRRDYLLVWKHSKDFPCKLM